MRRMRLKDKEARAERWIRTGDGSRYIVLGSEFRAGIAPETRAYSGLLANRETQQTTETFCSEGSANPVAVVIRADDRTLCEWERGWPNRADLATDQGEI